VRTVTEEKASLKLASLVKSRRDSVPMLQEIDETQGDACTMHWVMQLRMLKLQKMQAVL